MDMMRSKFQSPIKTGGINLQMNGAKGMIKRKPAICAMISCVCE
jgi:hypothetical protein